MPVYRRISLNELQLWLLGLKRLSFGVYKHPTKSSVLYLVVSLYEYVQVLSKNIKEVVWKSVKKC